MRETGRRGCREEVRGAGLPTVDDYGKRALFRLAPTNPCYPPNFRVNLRR